MEKLLLKFYNLFKLTFLSPKGTVSSKRLIGFLMITEAGFLIAYSVFMKLHFDKTLDENLKQEDMVTSAYCISKKEF